MTTIACKQLTQPKGNQLRRDLNVIVGVGKNWKIPFFLPILLRYISGPVLAIIFSFAYPEFHTLRYDPMMITGFILSHLVMLVIIIGYAVPRYYDGFIPIKRRGDGTEPTFTMQTKGELDGKPIANMAERGEALQEDESEKDRSEAEVAS